MPVKNLDLFDNQKVTFLGKTCSIKERKDPIKLKKLPKFYLIILPKKTKDDYISSLYDTRNPAVKAFEYHKKEYVLNLETNTCQDDEEGFYMEGRQMFSRRSTG